MDRFQAPSVNENNASVDTRRIYSMLKRGGVMCDGRQRVDLLAAVLYITMAVVSGP